MDLTSWAWFIILNTFNSNSFQQFISYCFHALRFTVSSFIGSSCILILLILLRNFIIAIVIFFNTLLFTLITTPILATSHVLFFFTYAENKLKFPQFYIWCSNIIDSYSLVLKFFYFRSHLSWSHYLKFI